MRLQKPKIWRKTSKVKIKMGHSTVVLLFQPRNPWLTKSRHWSYLQNVPISHFSWKWEQVKHLLFLQDFVGLNRKVIEDFLWFVLHQLCTYGKIKQNNINLILKLNYLWVLSVNEKKNSAMGLPMEQNFLLSTTKQPGVWKKNYNKQNSVRLFSTKVRASKTVQPGKQRLFIDSEKKLQENI